MIGLIDRLDLRPQDHDALKWGPLLVRLGQGANPGSSGRLGPRPGNAGSSCGPDGRRTSSPAALLAVWHDLQKILDSRRVAQQRLPPSGPLCWHVSWLQPGRRMRSGADKQPETETRSDKWPVE